MQELFTLQRWRRISALKEHQPVPKVNVKGQEGGEVMGTKGEHFDSWTTPVSEGDVLLLLQHSIPHPSPSIRPAHTPSPLSIPFRVVSNALDLPLDSRFSRHLFGGGVLCATELQYFISRLSFSSSSSSTADIASSSSFRPRASRDGLYSFFVGSTPGSEVGDLYMFLNETGFDAVNRRKKREKEALNRMRDIDDRHRDYNHHSNALSLPLLVSVSGSPGCTVSDRDTGSRLNGGTTTVSTSSKGIEILHYQDTGSRKENRNLKGRQKENLKRREGGGGEGVVRVRVSVPESTYSSFFSSSSVLLCEDAHSSNSAESSSDEDEDEDEDEEEDKEGSSESKDEGIFEKKLEETLNAQDKNGKANRNRIGSDSGSDHTAIAERGVNGQEEESTDVEEVKEQEIAGAVLAASGEHGHGQCQGEGGRGSAVPMSITIPSCSRDWSAMSPSNGRVSQTNTESKAKTQGFPHSPSHSHSGTPYRSIGKALTSPVQRTGIADLMPLSVQLEISVSQPLRRARASELYSAVTGLREKHLLGTHFKCKCSAVSVALSSIHMTFFPVSLFRFHHHVASIPPPLITFLSFPALITYYILSHHPVSPQFSRMYFSWVTLRYSRR
jgi:hypothetical protein